MWVLEAVSPGTTGNLGVKKPEMALAMSHPLRWTLPKTGFSGHGRSVAPPARVSHQTPCGICDVSTNPCASYRNELKNVGVCAVGLERGWFPRDPRQAAGICRRVVAEQGFPALSVNTTFTSFPEPWMTGGLGAGNLAQAQLIRYGTWPPTSIREPIGTRATNLPTYTATGTPIAMFTSMPTITATIIRGSNWGKLNETAGFYVPVAGCVSRAVRRVYSCVQLLMRYLPSLTPLHMKVLMHPSLRHVAEEPKAAVQISSTGCEYQRAPT